jgi:hypothetical protein
MLGVMAEIRLGKMWKALELASANRRSIRSVVCHLFERIAKELARSPQLARAFISSFLASKGVRQLLERNVSEGRRMVAQIVELGQKRDEIDPKLKNNRHHRVARIADFAVGKLLSPVLSPLVGIRHLLFDGQLHNCWLCRCSSPSDVADLRSGGKCRWRPDVRAVRERPVCHGDQAF